MSRPPTRAFYLTQDQESTYALFDSPQGAHNSLGVLLCPLFGNDDLCAYRARRQWAQTLAGAGYPTLRFDLPGSGDSAGGPHDPGRVEAWTRALAAAAGWLRTAGGSTRVAAIGIGLGGLLAYRAAAAGATIDDLVLWSVPVRGRTFVRQLRALSQLEASRETAAQERDPALEPGALASAGFVMSAETIAALEALDLTTLELPKGAARRVMLLERDGLEVDGRLRTVLERSGAEVTTASGRGYGAMVTPPQKSQPPTEVFATVARWLAAGATLASAAPATPAAPAAVPVVTTDTTLELEVEGTRVRERPLAIPHGHGLLVGVLAEPEGEARYCAVLLNAGALRHIGPNRMWVEIARRWAARGVPTLRIDLAGIGDADGDAAALEEDEGFYVQRYVDQTNDVLAALAGQGLPTRFVLAGLCSGAYWAFQAALEDERVRGAFMINPRALFWDPSVDGVREARNVRKLLRLETWRKLVAGQIEGERIAAIARGVAVALASLPRRLRAYRRERRANDDELGRALARLDSSETELLGVFTAGEPVFEELQRDDGLERARAHANVRVESIPGPLTSHTLEPLALQRAVHALLDSALTRVLERGEQSLSSAEPGRRASTG